MVSALPTDWTAYSSLERELAEKEVVERARRELAEEEQAAQRARLLAMERLEAVRSGKLAQERWDAKLAARGRTTREQKWAAERATRLAEELPVAEIAVKQAEESVADVRARIGLLAKVPVLLGGLADSAERTGEQALPTDWTGMRTVDIVLGGVPTKLQVDSQRGPYIYQPDGSISFNRAPDFKREPKFHQLSRGQQEIILIQAARKNRGLAAWKGEDFWKTAWAELGVHDYL
eukprot:gnl/TRDRNA2_/TRDRNA2_119005_c0_seq1.p1 gnl/TRDRNA2_/TRDRNA2_119005_c0~~gnl/TRDRNA2_/TRDRNA2_119005_c0_seq1.p1  ORF type:complete len:234 (-),score=45.30 gnl/TRDRNA2_/TRDRNA2_119005_c0_seq1:97-798(-)